MTPNTDQERIHQLTEIVNQSTMMLEFAHQGDWISVQEIEKNRKQMISEFFAQPAPKAMEEQVAKALRVLVETEIALVELSATDHIDYKKKLEMFKKAQNGLDEYKKNE